MPITPPASVSVTFGTRSGRIRLSLLDQDYANLVNFLNTVLNYSNYLVDEGAANAYVVNFDAGLTFSLTAGQIIQMKAVNANSGASTLTVNGGAAKSIKLPNGNNPASNDIPAGGIMVLIYTGTVWQIAGGLMGGGGSSIELQVNGTPNSDQSVLNLVQDDDIVITDLGSGSVTVAVGPNIPRLDVVNTWNASQIGVIQALISSSTVTPDFNVANNFEMVTTVDFVLDQPDNPNPGQAGTIVFTQGVTPRTITFDGFWRFPGGVPPALTSSAGAVDSLSYYVTNDGYAVCNMLNDIS